MDMNLKNIAYEVIKGKIITCEYRPNTFLSEAFLMQEIDASRTPIREALNKLEQEGFVQIIPKKGVVVTALSLNEVNMTFEARLLLEPYIIHHYMEFIDLHKIREIYSQTEHLVPGEEFYADFCRLDDTLHRLISSACSNKFLNESLIHIYDQNNRIRILAGKNIWQRHIEAAKEHLVLMDLILQGKKEEAAESITNHLIKSKTEAIRSLINEQMPIN